MRNGLKKAQERKWLKNKDVLSDCVSGSVGQTVRLSIHYWTFVESEGYT